MRRDKRKEPPAEATADSSNMNLIQEHDSTDDGKSQGRKRVYAFLVYPDSAPDDWLDRLNAEHVQALVSPIHDRDINPDGSAKKEHYHVMVIYEGPHSRKQLDELRARVLGPNFNPGFESVASMRGYARYLIHADNPEKAQYSREDVIELGGADYDSTVILATDDMQMIADMMVYIREHDIRYFSDFMMVCRANNPEWFRMLAIRRSTIIIEFIKSEAYKREREQRDYNHNLYPRHKVDPETGEFIEIGEDNHEGQD